jgi:hypothetical protein
MRIAANTGVCGGVSWSSNASLCGFVVVRSNTWLEAARVGDAGDAGDVGAGDVGAGDVGANGVVLMGEEGALMCGEAPSKPMIDGSR